MKEKKLRFVISGGGTGGHIFPAVSIANALKEIHPDADILFVGALGRMEMQCRQRVIALLDFPCAVCFALCGGSETYVSFLTFSRASAW